MDISALRQIAQQEQIRQKPVRINCCTASGCASSGSGAVKKNLETAIKAGCHDELIEVGSVGCMGFCGRGPLVIVEASERQLHRQLYANVTPEAATSLVKAIASIRLIPLIPPIPQPHHHTWSK
ncbi:MAG: (2Fe-2S) ferredoxin domain-containing protein [Coleofasciculaceae cyanobacterium RL_1_1]|nr:(2Fe-2S) ferredoxin domain-containing protein [Coleofasciculaceae cyanobacterium RL_1_1]